MTMEAPTGVVIAGWYPDPHDGGLARWWDGIQWTTMTRSRQPEVQPPIVPGPMYPSAYRPPERVHPMTRFYPTLAYTGSVWVIATMPLWATVVIVAAFLGLGEFYTSPAIAFTSFIIFIITVAFAVHDHTVLLNSLHVQAASAWWMLLGPMVYLIVRGVHVSRNMGRGWAPLVTYVLCSFIPAMVALAFSWLIVSFASLFGGM